MTRKGSAVCELLAPLSLEDWNAVDERLTLPDTVVMVEGTTIRDHANHVDIRGGVLAP